MGIGDLVNSGLGKIEDGFDAGKKLVGEAIDRNTDLIGEGLDYVGAHDWADKVEDFGDSAASALGATPGEQQLGQTDDAGELVHGDESAIRARAKHLKDFHTAFDKVGQGMRKLDSSQWQGEAADAFRKKFAMHPAKWLHAADACDKAGEALQTYADTVKWAQGQAREAIRLYKKGKDASDKAVAAYNKRVDAYNAALKTDKDPGPARNPSRTPAPPTSSTPRRSSARPAASATTPAAPPRSPYAPPSRTPPPSPRPSTVSNPTRSTASASSTPRSPMSRAASSRAPRV